MDNKMLPQDRDAEMALIGSMMVSGAAIEAALPSVTAGAFYHPGHAALFTTLAEMHEEGLPIDLVTVTAELSSRGQLEAVGGQEYMIQLAESFADLGAAEHYARFVRDAHQRRELIVAGQRLTAEAYAPFADPAELAAMYAQQLDTIGTTGRAASVRLAADLVEELPAQLTNTGNTFVRTGLDTVDAAIGGLERGGLAILAARPSVGKTALGLHIALQTAKSGTPVLFVSVEMTAQAIATRLTASLGNTTVHRLRQESTPDEIRRAVSTAQTTLAHCKLFVTDSAVNVRDIVAIARQKVRQDAVALVVIDYLQLCQPASKEENRNLAVAAMSAEFKRMAVQTNVAVLVLSQLSRSGAEGRPTLAQLRDSGAIEQDADVVMLLWRETKDPNVRDVRVLLEVAKNRNGPTGRFSLAFHRPTMRFSTAAPRGSA